MLIVWAACRGQLLLLATELLLSLGSHFFLLWNLRRMSLCLAPENTEPAKASHPAYRIQKKASSICHSNPRFHPGAFQVLLKAFSLLRLSAGRKSSDIGGLPAWVVLSEDREETGREPERRFLLSGFHLDPGTAVNQMDVWTLSFLNSHVITWA